MKDELFIELENSIKEGAKILKEKRSLQESFPLKIPTQKLLEND